LNRSARQLWVMVVLPAAIQCSSPTGAACTAEFVTYPVIVTDPADSPISDAHLTVTVRRTGQRLTPQTLIMYIAGTYPLIDDGARPAQRETGDELRVVASTADASIEADYVFDVPGGCHVHKVSGPDTLVLP
jgi:hypothetical protein